ncbi:MAG: tetratricopeptide (TPR) repeat protein [Cyclobacteriaceae bacterium]|jgi:tetratricopeptide (TPR) repeat protein
MLGPFKFFIIIFLFWQINSLKAQNLYDYSNSIKYADFLFKSSRFNEATEEYNRILFMNQLDTSSWLKLVKSYQKQGKHKNALEIYKVAALNIGINPKLNSLKVYSLLKLSNFKTVRDSLSNRNRTLKEEFYYSMSYALASDWDMINTNEFNFSDQSPIREVLMLAKEYSFEKKKTPFVAGLLSAAVPGTGKIYTRRWKDALFSFLLTSATGWQAYRIISKGNIKSFEGVFFTGLAFGFYTGNVYGSIKSAVSYNQEILNEYNQRANYILDTHFK